MKEADKNNIDRLFNEALGNAENRHHFRESDWDAMEELLDEKQKRRELIPWYYISGVAAVLLLGFAWYFFSPAVSPVKNNANNSTAYTAPKAGTTKAATTNNIVNGGTDTTGDHQLQSVRSGRQHQYTASAAVTGFQKKLGSNEAGQGSSASKVLLARSGRLVKNKVFFPLKPIEDYITAEQPVEQTQQGLTLAAANEAGVGEINSTLSSADVHDSQLVVAPGEAVEGAPKPKIKSLSNRPQLSLAVVAAPDLNGVANLNSPKVGTNYGLLFSLQLSKRWSITTGAAYAVKPYSADGAQYKTPVVAYKVNPSEVFANCKVLDIPLNVNYQVYGKGRNAIAVGTGLSSYFMLREHYAMTFYNYNKEYINNYDFVNQNKHILSVLNLNATYERRLNSKVSAIIQPYYKLPLSGIGAGKVNLQSTGVALGFNWNFGSKPK